MGEKIGYGVTLTLTLLVNMSIVTDFLPVTSDTFPKLYNYFLVSIGLSAISVVLSTISQLSLASTGSASGDNGNSGNINNSAFNTSNLNQSEQSNKQRGMASSLETAKEWMDWAQSVMKKRMTRRKLDMLIGLVYFVGTMIFTAVFFADLHQDK